MQESIQLTIKEIIAEITEVDSREIKMGTHLIQDHGADSMSVLELIHIIENEFQIDIPPENLPEMVTLEKMTDLVTSILSLEGES